MKEKNVVEIFQVKPELTQCRIIQLKKENEADLIRKVIEEHPSGVKGDD